MKKEKTKTYRLKTKLWIYPGEKANWHFLTVPKKEPAEIYKKFKTLARGWGSLPVEVSVRKTKWKTSIFPDKKSSTYLLPVKSAIRRTEYLESGDVVAYTLTLLA